MLLYLLSLLFGPWGLQVDAKQVTLFEHNHGWPDQAGMRMHLGSDYWVMEGSCCNPMEVVSPLKWLMLQPNGGSEPF